MMICLTWKIIVCGMLCVFPVDIKGQTCKCLNGNGRECKSCTVGCYLVSNSWCYECREKCYSCSSRKYCEVCKKGYYGPSCDYDCETCLDGSCTNNVCTYGCADGYYHDEREVKCRQCPNKCVTCNSNSECTSCLEGSTGSYCQHCNPGYYLHDGQCNQCNTNCLHDTCFDNSGECTGCKNGWTGWRCNDACGPNCASCDRTNGTACISCKPGYYGPSCNNVCQQLSGECLFDCSQLLCSQDGRTSDAKINVNVTVLGGAVGSAVMIVLAVAAVLVLMFLRKRRRNEADPERSVTYENSPIDTVPCNPSVTGNDSATKFTAHHKTLTLSLGPVPNREAHYTALTPSLGPVCEELDKNDDVDNGDIKDYEVPITSNYRNT